MKSIKQFKSLFLLLIIAFAFNYSFAQEKVILGCSKLYEFNSNFYNRNDSINSYFIIDTNNVNNIWEIGENKKMNFGSSYGLMTGLTNSYPINNISSFKIGVVTCSGLPKNTSGFYYSDISFEYFCRTEKNKDGVVVETKLNNNGTWRNAISDTNIFISSQSNFYSVRDTIKSAGNKPGFTGASGASYTTHIIGIYPAALKHEFDTIWVKFTFYSDSNATNHAGFNIANLSVNGIFSGIENTKVESLEINPNPTSGKLIIQNLDVKEFSEISLYSIHGKLISTILLSENKEIDISSYVPGIYLLKSGNKQKRIVKY